MLLTKIVRVKASELNKTKSIEELLDDLASKVKDLNFPTVIVRLAANLVNDYQNLRRIRHQYEIAKQRGSDPSGVPVISGRPDVSPQVEAALRACTAAQKTLSERINIRNLETVVANFVVPAADVVTEGPVVIKDVPDRLGENAGVSGVRLSGTTRKQSGKKFKNKKITVIL
eukprot:Trichotokara_eunicae@DN5782_c0_g1_i2.p1